MKIPVRVQCDKNLFFLFSLCHVCKLSFPHFLFLYDKYGKDIFYLFYICAGRKFRFPQIDRIGKIDESCEKVFNKINGEDEIELTKVLEKDIYEKVLECYEIDTEILDFEMDLGEEDGREQKVKKISQIQKDQGSPRLSGPTKGTEQTKERQPTEVQRS